MTDIAPVVSGTGLTCKRAAIPTTTEIHLGLKNCRCESTILTDGKTLVSLLADAVRAAGLQVVSTHYYDFDGAGTTGVVLLAESHINAHTWPECRNFVQVDISVCNYSKDNTSNTLRLGREVIDRLKPDDVDSDVFFSKNRTHYEHVDEGYGFFIDRPTMLENTVTPYQMLQIFNNPSFGNVLKLDNYVQTTERDEFFYHEPIAHVPMLAHPDPKRVLIIGGGDGGTARQVLKHNTVQTVLMIDIDEDVVALSRKHLSGVHGGVFDDPRLDVRCMDGLAYMRNNRQRGERFDVIILDLSDPKGAAATLYEKEFYELCKSNLHDDGYLSTHAEYPFFMQTMHGRIIATLSSVFKYVRPYYSHVPSYGSVMSFAACSDAADAVDIAGNTVSARIADRALSDLKYLNAATFAALMAQPNYVRDIYDMNHRIICSEDPLRAEDLGANETHNNIIQPLS